MNPPKRGAELWAIAQLAEPVVRHGELFVRAAEGLVKTNPKIGTDQLARVADRTVKTRITGT
jgi:hypothetical protein